MDVTKVLESDHRQVEELFAKIENPALTDVELRWPAGARVDMAFSEVPDLYYGEPVVVTARLQGEVAGLLALTGRSGSGAWIRQAPLSSARAHEGVASLGRRVKVRHESPLGTERHLHDICSAVTADDHRGVGQWRSVGFDRLARDIGAPVREGL